MSNPLTTLPDRLPHLALAAMQRGDVNGMLEALGADLAEGIDPETRWRTLAHRVSNMALELRRQSVAVISDHEAFVQHTPQGSLRRVLKPVTLSMADGTLYQITGRRPVCVEQGHSCFGQVAPKNHSGRVDWREVPIGDPRKATVTYPGYLAMNAVAGCAVGQPPSVVVDGEERTNPYVERWVDDKGRKRDVIRVVIGIVVVGPAPETGNPVVVNYTLDYDPSKDLASMLDRIAKDHPDDCYLAPEALADVELETKPGWHFLPVAGGVGYFYNLRLEAVREAYGKYVEIQGNAMKKAQTVARRNAMKSHPALGRQYARINDQGVARVPVTGWSSQQMGQWMDIQERLSKGLDLPEIEGLEVINSAEAYDVEQHGATGDAEDVLSQPAEDDAPSSTGIDPEVERKNQLILDIDAALDILNPGQIAELGYDPANQTIKELEAISKRASAMVDAALQD